MLLASSAAAPAVQAAPKFPVGTTLVSYLVDGSDLGTDPGEGALIVKGRLGAENGYASIRAAKEAATALTRGTAPAAAILQLGNRYHAASIEEYDSFKERNSSYHVEGREQPHFGWRQTHDTPFAPIFKALVDGETVFDVRDATRAKQAPKLSPYHLGRTSLATLTWSRSEDGAVWHDTTYAVSLDDDKPGFTPIGTSFDDAVKAARHEARHGAGAVAITQAADGVYQLSRAGLFDYDVEADRLSQRFTYVDVPSYSPSQEVLATKTRGSALRALVGESSWLDFRTDGTVARQDLPKLPKA